MSYEDQEFEVARRVVGLGAEATKAASQGPGRNERAGAAGGQGRGGAAAQTHAPGSRRAAAIAGAAG